MADEHTPIEAKYSYQEVADMFEVPLSTVKWWTQSKRIAIVREGRRCFITQSAVLEFIDRMLANPDVLEVERVKKETREYRRRRAFFIELHRRREQREQRK